jgi:hypothetical protein
MPEMKERQQLNNLLIDHVMIGSKLKYIIVANAVGTVELEPQFGSNLLKYPLFYVGLG